MSLMIIKHRIPEVFRSIDSDDITSAKEFLTEIEKRFAKSDKAETSTLLQNLSRKRKCQGIHYGNVKYCFKIKGTRRAEKGMFPTLV